MDLLKAELDGLDFGDLELDFGFDDEPEAPKSHRQSKGDTHSEKPVAPAHNRKGKKKAEEPAPAKSEKKAISGNKSSITGKAAKSSAANTKSAPLKPASGKVFIE
mgnify:CR=1 FL=1